MDQQTLNNISARLTVIPLPGRRPAAAVWVKGSFDITCAGGLRPSAEAAPLAGDPLDPEAGNCGLSDLWPVKERPDLVVQGSAFAPGGRPVRAMEISVSAGGRHRRVAVFGRRTITWTAPGRVIISAPEPFVQMPATWQNAYGGIDWRTPVAEPTSALEQLRLERDHPGLYPRNPFGKGYLIQQGEVPAMEMPNLEDPDDLLTADRLLTGTPERWYGQPLPACFDAAPPVSFPRCLFFADGCDAWHPAPEDAAMPEVAAGLLPADYRAMMRGRPLEHGPHPRFIQEAAPGLTLPGLVPGSPVTVRGMHPRRAEVGFALPSAPRLILEQASGAVPLTPRLHTVLVRPAEAKVTLLHAATCRLERRYLPGIHRKIPLSVAVESGPTLTYQAPTPMRDRLRKEMTHAQG